MSLDIIFYIVTYKSLSVYSEKLIQPPPANRNQELAEREDFKPNRWTRFTM